MKRGLGWLALLVLGTALWLVAREEGQQERQAWQQVVQSQQAVRMAGDFLQRFPDSAMAPQAHYLLADDAFRRQDLPLFARHAEAAAAQLESVLAEDPKQAVRWLQMLSQLAYYYAETGRSAEAIGHAQGLTSQLEGAGRPPNLSATQWQLYQAQLSATAHYALGRAWLEGDLEKAVRHLEEALDLNPLDGYAAYRLGAAYRLQGNRAQAMRGFARAALSGGAAAAPARQTLATAFADQLPDTQSIETLLQEERKRLELELKEHPRSIFALPDGRPHPVLWWDAVPESVQRERLQPSALSNVRRSDYAGAEACQICHARNYQAWSKHPHRWMNAVADSSTVVGDFSGKASIGYRGGRATFDRRQGKYRMHLERGGLKRSYIIERTLGSRFFQYYVGRLAEGPEPKSDPVWTVDHVLPFGYWIDERQWVPVVHIDDELPDAQRVDPFARASRVQYDKNCSACHTTRPLGDWLLMTDGRLRSGQFSPREFSFSLSGYLSEAHPDLLPGVEGGSGRTSDATMGQLQAMLQQQIDFLPARSHAVNLGISCEACHNGARLHAERSSRNESDLLPHFFPSSPHVFISGKQDAEQAWGRTSQNLNWTCARCHSGGRPRFAGGMDTWNSTEYSDAARGACYDAVGARRASMPQLTCVHCHNPHYATGKKWSRSADEDDASCLECHKPFQDLAARQKHTHHPSGSPGARCMNCHMPRINEGLQDVVRTHRIFSPTEPRMIEANQPNACNLCHLERSIDWTLKYLKEWYGASGYSEERLQAAYPQRRGPAGLGWLKSAHEPTRLAAAAALTQQRADWALPALIEMLDDPYLINRQFTQRGLEEMLGIPLQRFGYRFYLFPQERRQPLSRIRSELQRPKESGVRNQESGRGR